MTPIETVQALVDALDYMHVEKIDYMLRNHLGDPTKETASRLAVPALAAGRALLAQMQAGNGLAETERSDEKESAPVVQVVERE